MAKNAFLFIWFVFGFFYFSFHFESLEVDVLRVTVLLGLDVAVEVAVGHVGPTDVAFPHGIWLLGFAPRFSIRLDLLLKRNHVLMVFI